MASYQPFVFGLTALICFATVLHSGDCVKCWDCNSLNDPHCGDPFNAHSIAMIDCSQMSYSHLSEKEATFCRKSRQLINGKMRVIRSCGWLNSTHENEGKSCFQRSGSQDVYITHCTCYGDGCNGSPSLMPTALLTIPVLFTVLLYPLSTLITGFC